MGKMNGRVALITGGASGLGAEDARVLAREGAKVVITDMNVALGEAVAAEIPGALFLQQDVRDEARWRHAAACSSKATRSSPSTAALRTHEPTSPRLSVA